MARRLLLSEDRKRKTPTEIKIGLRISRSNDSACTTNVLPTSAPNTIARATAPPINPWPAKDAMINAVAVLLCRRAVTPAPAHAAVSRFFEDMDSARRRLAPNALVTPVRTIRMPHSRRATPPMILTSVAMSQSHLLLRKSICLCETRVSYDGYAPHFF